MDKSFLFAGIADLILFLSLLYFVVMVTRTEIKLQVITQENKGLELINKQGQEILCLLDITNRLTDIIVSLTSEIESLKEVTSNG